jgi:hypothetical protein
MAEIKLDPILTRMKELETSCDRLKEVNALLVDALQVLHDETADYIKINNLSGYENQSMRKARAALAAAKEGK